MNVLKGISRKLRSRRTSTHASASRTNATCCPPWNRTSGIEPMVPVCSSAERFDDPERQVKGNQLT